MNEKNNFEFTASVNDVSLLPNKLTGRSWTIKQREKIKWIRLINLIFGNNIPDKPLTDFTIEVVRCSPRQPDRDNLYGSFKYVIDALKANKIIQDDSPKYLKDLKCHWEQSKRHEFKTKIKIKGSFE